MDDRFLTAQEAAAELGISLANDRIKLGSLHPGLLQLLEGLSRIDALVLANVSYEQYLILRTNLAKEIAHLLGRCQ